MAKDAECIFCRIIAGEIPAHRVAESEHCVAVLDAFPATRGHTLVLTREHRADMLGMSDAELADAASLMKRLGAAAQKALGCAGINFINNLGSRAGQVVMHAHFHVLPRYDDDTVGMTFEQLEPGDAEKESVCKSIRENL